MVELTDKPPLSIGRELVVIVLQEVRADRKALHRPSQTLAGSTSLSRQRVILNSGEMIQYFLRPGTDVPFPGSERLPLYKVDEDRLEIPMNAAILGETVALLTSVMWAFTAVFFTFAGARVGSFAVNRVRLLMAVILLGLTLWISQGTPFPPDASPRHWLWFGLSGLIGLALGDSFLFQSFLELGPRKAALVMSSWPIFSALLSYVLLAQALSVMEWLGVLLTLSGIAWVVLEKSNSGGTVAGANSSKGVFFAFAAAFCQALGIVVAKKGLDGTITSLSGTMIRMLTAAAAIWAVTLLAGRAKESVVRMKDGRALFFTALGSIVGPFLGVWMSLVAVEHAKVGVASALMALMPVMMLPLGRIFFGDRITPRSVLGTFAAFFGVVVLFMYG